MLAKVQMQEVVKVAEKYECDVEQVLDLLEEGFNLEEAEEIIKEAEF